MTFLRDARTAIKDILVAEEIDQEIIYTEVPEVIPSRGIIIIPNDEWIRQGLTYRDSDLHHDIVIVADFGTNETQALSIDDLVENVYIALQLSQGVSVIRVSNADQYTANGRQILAAVMEVKQNVKLLEGE